MGVPRASCRKLDSFSPEDTSGIQAEEFFPTKYLFRNQGGVPDFKIEQLLIPVVVKNLYQMNSTKQALFRNRGQVYFSVDLNENNLPCLPFS